MNSVAQTRSKTGSDIVSILKKGSHPRPCRKLSPGCGLAVFPPAPVVSWLKIHAD